MDLDVTNAHIGWIGTGVMGASMCGHILQAGHAVTVHTRTRSKSESLLQRGAAWADSPKSVAERSDVVVTIVGFPEDVREVYFAEHGVLAGIQGHSVVIDMTTTSPSLACEIYDAAKQKGVSAVDAPVSGGDVGAQNAKLSIMVGGDREVVQAIDPLFKLMGRNVVYQGGAGAGQHTKMCNQITIATTMVGVCEALL